MIQTSAVAAGVSMAGTRKLLLRSRESGVGADATHRDDAVDAILRQPGDHVVDVPIICVITRFRLRGTRHFVPVYLMHRRVMRQLRGAGTPGFLRAVLLFELPACAYSISFWAERAAIARFGSDVPLHVQAARSIFGRVRHRDGAGPEIWSTKWNLRSVSNNLVWDDFDLRDLITTTAAAKETR